MNHLNNRRSLRRRTGMSSHPIWCNRWKEREPYYRRRNADNRWTRQRLSSIEFSRNGYHNPCTCIHRSAYKFLVKINEIVTYFNLFSRIC